MGGVTQDLPVGLGGGGIVAPPALLRGAVHEGDDGRLLLRRPGRGLPGRREREHKCEKQGEEEAQAHPEDSSEEHDFRGNVP